MSKKLYLFLHLSVIVFFLCACCGPIKSPQLVDVSPLQEAKIPQDAVRASDIFDTEIFDTYDPILEKGEWTGNEKNPDLVRVEVYFWLLNDKQSPQEEFMWECERWWNSTDGFIFGGDPDNQFCISYVNGMRYPPDALCMPTGDYESFVVFQKGKVIITVLETSKDKAGLAKNEAIELLSQAIKK